MLFFIHLKKKHDHDGEDEKLLLTMTMPSNIIQYPPVIKRGWLEIH